MTVFKEEYFNFNGLFLMYDGVFIARFKRGGMEHFKNFLINNFNVEEYLQLCKGMTPSEILSSKGYVKNGSK